MCTFTYLGYDRCDEPERHYLIRREKCGAKANLKHWCAPHGQEEASTADQSGKFWVSLPCPMCAETPVIYDQPLLEIAHSRRSVLPAPHYDAVTRKYSRLPKHQAAQEDLPAGIVPAPLKTHRLQLQRAATESVITMAKAPAAVDSSVGDYTLPATTYVPSTRDMTLPQPFPIPQPATLTPPSSRESSRSPPQIHMDGPLRTTPPGDGSRRELESIREKARAAATATTQESGPNASERFRSGSTSSFSSNGIGRPSQPSRQASNASISTASSLASRAAAKTGHRPQRQASSSGSPPQGSVADNLAAAALRSIGIDRGGSRTTPPSDSPERGRRTRRRPTGGSSSDRSDSPCVWRPTISPPVLQNDSLGIGVQADSTVVEPFKQRLVPFPPNKGAATANAASIATGGGLVEDPQRPKTPHPARSKPPVLRLFPNDADDEDMAAAAFERMFAAECKAHAYQVKVQAQAQASAEAQAQDQAQGAAQKKERALPSVPAALRRVKTGQVKTVTVAAPRRQNTSDSTSFTASSFRSPPQPPASANIMTVNTGPLFSFAGVGGKAQEFEIVTGPDGAILQDPEYGQAF